MDPKAKAEKKAREEKHLQRFLGRDGGKTLGAKYLVSNGKAKLDKSSRREGREGANGTESEDTDDAGARASKKRVFDVAAVRKIGWDPSSLNMDSASKLAKQRQVMGTSRIYQRMPLMMGIVVLSSKRPTFLAQLLAQHQN
jgi:hypothetical protein